MADIPAINGAIRLSYDGGGFAAMRQDAAKVASEAKREFENNFADIGRIISGAVKNGLNSFGTLDLGTAQFREAAAQAKLYRASLEQTFKTAEQGAQLIGDTTASTRSYLAALEAQTKEARINEAATQAQFTSYTRLQSAMNSTASSATALREAYRGTILASREFAQAQEELANRQFAAFQNRNLSGKSAAASASVFETQSYRPKVDLSSGVDKLLSGSASIDRAAISATTLDQVLRRVSQSAGAAGSAIEGTAKAAGVGTTANHLLVNSTRSLRIATLQAGQQLQDIGISLYSGQKAGVVFAQQLPQLAFALSYLEGSTNKTHAAIGRYATFLSGPWGLAVGLAVGVVGSFVASLFESEEQTDKTARASRSFVEVLNDSTSSYVEVANAAKAYTDQQEKSRQITIQQIAVEAEAIKARLQSAIATRAQLAAQIELLQKQAQASAGNPNGNPAGFYLAAGQKQDEAIANQKVINELTKAAGEITIKAADRISELNSDPTEKIREGFRLLRKNAQGTIKDVGQLSARLTDLRNQENVAIKAEKDAKKVGSSRTIDEGTLQQNKEALARFERELNARGIFRAAGATEFRTAADQNRQFRAGLSPLDGYKKLSPHQQYRALDPGVGKNNDAGAYAAAQAAGLRGFQIVNESGGRKHYQFKSAVSDYQAFTAAGKEAEQEQEKLARALDHVRGQFDEAEIAAGNYRKTLNEIQALKDAGLISSGDALKYDIGAFTAEQSRLQSQDAANAKKFYADVGIDPAQELQDIVKQAGDDWIEDNRKAADIYLQRLSQGNDVIARVLGNKAGNVANLVSQNSALNGPFNQFLKGIGEADDKFLKAQANLFKSVFSNKFVASISGAVGAAIAGYQNAGPLGAAVGGAQQLFKNSKAGLGKLIGSLPVPEIQAAIAANQALNTLFGNDDRKGGKTLHTILGPILSLGFKKKKGTATITNSGTTYSGSGSYRDGLTGAGDNISSTLANIAEALNGSVGSFSTAIKQKGKKYYVNGQKFKDPEEAARAALLDAINQGAVKGIREGSQNLLRAGKDIETQLAKAVKFENVFTRLKQYTDPVGAALDTLDREFTNLKTIFTEAGASAADYATLTALYEKDRAAAITQANDQIIGSLRSLHEELTTGDNGLSLRDRLSNALQDYNPLKARVDAGDSSSYDKFAESFKLVLDLRRQIEGSSQGYFDFLKEGTDITGRVISNADNIASISSGRASIFTPAETAAPVVSALDQLQAAQTAQLTAVNANLGALLAIFNTSYRADSEKFALASGF